MTTESEKHGVGPVNTLKIFLFGGAALIPTTTNLKRIDWGTQTENSSRQAANLMLSEPIGPTDAKYRLLIETPTKISVDNKVIGIPSITITRLTDSQDIQNDENGRPSITLQRVGAVTTDILVPAEAKNGAVVYESTGLIITQDMLSTNADGTSQRLSDYSPDGKLYNDGTIGDFTYGKMRVIVSPNRKGHNSVRASIIADNGKTAVSGIVFDEVEPIDEQGIQIAEDTENNTILVRGADTRALERKQKEVREFVPAETAELSSNLKGHELKFAPDVDLKAIYWDIAVVQLGNATSNSKGLEQNRKIYEEIIKDFPQWEGIGSGTDYKERVAFMKEFLRRTDGTMIIQDHNFNKFEVDFNKPVKFKVDEVETLSPTAANFLGLNGDNPYGRGGGGIIYTENGQITYKVEIVQKALDAATTDDRSIYKKWNWKYGEVVSDILRQVISFTAFKDKDSDLHNYFLFTKGSEPKKDTYYRDVNWTIIQ